MKSIIDQLERLENPAQIEKESRKGHFLIVSYEKGDPEVFSITDADASNLFNSLQQTFINDSPPPPLSWVHFIEEKGGPTFLKINSENIKSIRIMPAELPT